jgi:hypothetical protein
MRLIYNYHHFLVVWCRVVMEMEMEMEVEKQQSSPRFGACPGT